MKQLMTLGLLTTLVLATTDIPARSADPERINQAIDRGVKSLRSLQLANGTWPHDKIGATALAGTSALACGAAKDDKDVLRAAEVVRKVAPI